MQIDITPFTLVGATTRSGLLSNPLRDRFVSQFHYDFYDDSELMEIIKIECKKLGISMSGRSVFINSKSALEVHRESLIEFYGECETLLLSIKLV